YYYQILGSISNGAVYLPDITCVYRINALGSWSSSRLIIDENKLIKELTSHEEHLLKLIKLGANKDDINFAISDLYRIRSNE
ncbi:hypothetical protein, partial [Klebsiella pneumoniae]